MKTQIDVDLLCSCMTNRHRLCGEEAVNVGWQAGEVIVIGPRQFRRYEKRHRDNYGQFWPPKKS